MIYALMIIAGILIAVIIDWSIYTHMSVYIGILLRLDNIPRYRLNILSGTLGVRFATVITSGALAGLSFATSDPILWICSLLLFSVAHVLLYIIFFKK